eukprot:GHVQ01025215.1.p1 GENE.GHVQ01025215.1~~GHVQ01025215.1.p1  ORF type:complete len:347 (-),score=46.32 GHVQ01025215.1:1788-2828(-)
MMISSHSFPFALTPSRRYSRDGDVVLTEDPTYFLAKETFKDYHLEVHSVPMNLSFRFRGQKPLPEGYSLGSENGCSGGMLEGEKAEEGVDLVALEEAVKRLRPKFFYTVPVGHNPSGVTTSQRVREGVLRLARQYNFIIIADEVYQLLVFQGYEAPPPFAVVGDELQRGNECRVISLNSFSKILAPAMRLGWIHTSKEMISDMAQVGMIRSGGALNPFMSRIAHETITRRMLGPIIDSNRESLSRKAVSILDFLKSGFPEDVWWCQPTAGYFVLLKLPQWLKAKCLLEACHKKKVGFLPGYEFSPNTTAEMIRISFSFYACEDIIKGLVIIAEAIEQLRQTHEQED